jgi:hypothetical protein
LRQRSVDQSAQKQGIDGGGKTGQGRAHQTIAEASVPDENGATPGMNIRESALVFSVLIKFGRLGIIGLDLG